MPKNEICTLFIKMGQVERFKNKKYVWHDAYSENGNTYPWLTKIEAQRKAKSEDRKAIFIDKYF
jgi:hypothetical protein